MKGNNLIVIKRIPGDWFKLNKDIYILYLGEGISGSKGDYEELKKDMEIYSPSKLNPRAEKLTRIITCH